MKLIIIAAVARNRVIGKDGKLPWHFSEDLQRFKGLTTGHTVLMGRKTFESLSKPLPNRRNVVLSSRPISGIECYNTVDDALRQLLDQEKVFVIGGGEIFGQLLGIADALFLTLVEKDVEGDTFFPPYEDLVKKEFREESREQRDGFVFVDYVRR